MLPTFYEVSVKRAALLLITLKSAAGQIYTSFLITGVKNAKVLLGHDFETRVSLLAVDNISRCKTVEDPSYISI